jgi:hypothetical protein
MIKSKASPQYLAPSAVSCVSRSVPIEACRYSGVDFYDEGIISKLPASEHNNMLIHIQHFRLYSAFNSPLVYFPFDSSNNIQ